MALDMNAAVKIQASVDGIASINGLEKSLDRVDKQAGGLQGTFNRVKGAAGGLTSSLGGLVPAIGLAGLGALGKRSIDAADNLNDLSQRTGVGVEALDKFGKAANDSGSSLDEVAKAMGKLAKGIVDPASKTNEALKSIGINSTDAQGKIRGVDAIMLDLADKFSKMPDGVEKTALAMEIFGKSGANIIPMLNEGKTALNEYSATIDKDMAAAADKFNDSINKVTASISGPFNEAIVALLPTITKLAEGIAALAKGFSQLPKPLQDAIVLIGAFGFAFKILSPIITGVVTAFKLFAALKIGAIIAGWLPIIGQIGTALAVVGRVLLGVFTGPVGWATLLVTAGVAIYAFRDQIGAAFKAIGDVLGAAGKLFYDVFIVPAMNALKPFFIWINTNFIYPIRDAITNFAKSLWTAIDINFIQPWAEGLAKINEFIYNTFILPATTAFTDFTTTISTIFTNIQTTITNVFTAVIEFINTNVIIPITTAFTDLDTTIGTLFNNIKTTITNVFTAIMEFINLNFIEPVRNAINNLTTTIGNAFTNTKTTVTNIFKAITEFIDAKFVKPVQDTINSMIKNIATAFQSVKDAITRPFEAAMQTVRGIVNSILRGIGSAIFSVVNAINNVIQGANQALANLRLPQIPYLPRPNIPQFAQGGVVNGPTLAMVGEGNEREYIIPESKMGRASANYMAGARGGAVIPAFANGGVVGSSRTLQGRNSTTTIKPQISIQTGPVMQMNGTNYVTMQDLGRAVQIGVRQTIGIIQGDMNMRNQMGLT